jgi:polysaccharide biosynthesis/export protein
MSVEPKISLCVTVPKFALLIAAAFTLSACSGLPSGGPNSKDIIGAADRSDKSPYRLIEITPQVAEALSGHTGLPATEHFSSLAGAGGGQGISVGDTLSITVFEASAGGLFAPHTDTTTSGAPRLNLPPQIVDRNGTISVPYAGTIKAAGRSPQEVQRTIEKRLASRAIEPQAIVSIVSNDGRLVSVTGDVMKSGRVPLVTGKERLLDALAAAGGQRGTPFDTYIKLTRGYRSEAMVLQGLVNSPTDNITLQPGDEIFVSQNAQKFIALGASTENSEVPFGADRLTLAEAVAKAGGLDDRRADPAGVFVFRYEDASIFRQPPVASSSTDGHVPVVYRLNLKQPGGLLAMQRFMVRDKDVIYFANAPSTELGKFLALLGAGVGISNNTATTAVRVVN